MQSVFGYHDETGEAPLYSNPGGDIINYFANLNVEDSSLYFNKFINICVGGKWEADNIRQAFGFHNRIVNDSETIFPLLLERKDEEIVSVFEFIFDGPHPDNQTNKEIYSELQRVIPINHNRLEDLLKLGYENVINSEHNH